MHTPVNTHRQAMAFLRSDVSIRRATRMPAHTPTPCRNTEVMAMYIYIEAFTDFDFGRASAASAVLFVICMLVSFVYIRITNQKEERV